MTYLGSNCFAYSKIKKADLSRTKLTRFEGIYTFFYSSLEEIILPDTLKDLAHFCFGYTNLTSFTFPRDFETLDCPFGCCTKLNVLKSNSKNVKIHDGVAYSSDYKILYRYPCNGTQEIIPTITTFVSGVFSGCNFLNYVIETPVVYPNSRMFRYCQNLQIADISKLLITDIPAESFQECPSLIKIIFPEFLTYLAQNVFRLSTIKYLILPATVKSVDKEMLSRATVLNIEYCGLYQLNSVSQGSPTIRLNKDYKFSSFLGFTQFTKDLESCLSARTPLPTPAATPKCFYSIAECYSGPYLNFLASMIFIVLEDS